MSYSNNGLIRSTVLAGKQLDCFVIVLFVDDGTPFVAWDQDVDEPLVFTSVADAKEEALTYGHKKLAVAPAKLDGGGIVVDYDHLAWQTFPPKATKQHSR